MKCVSSIIASSLLLAATTVPTTQALKSYLNNIPNGASFTQPLGHPDSDETKFTDFATAFQAVDKTWTTEFCKATFPGSTMTNGEAFGDPCCTWKKGATADQTVTAFTTTPSKKTTCASATTPAPAATTAKPATTTTAPAATTVKPAAATTTTPAATTAAPAAATKAPAATTAAPSAGATPTATTGKPASGNSTDTSGKLPTGKGCTIKGSKGKGKGKGKGKDSKSKDSKNTSSGSTAPKTNSGANQSGY